MTEDFPAIRMMPGMTRHIPWIHCRRSSRLWGTGDYRTPACIIKNTDRTYCSDFRYESHSIKDGKYALQGLPAVYADDNEAQTLEVVLVDRVTGVRAVLLYGVLPEYDVITRSVCIVNASRGHISVKKLAPACLDLLGEIMII